MRLKKEDNVQTPRNVMCYLEGSNATEVFCRHISGDPRKEDIWRVHAICIKLSEDASSDEDFLHYLSEEVYL